MGPVDADPLTGDRIFHVQTDGANIGSVVIQDLSVSNGEVGLIPTSVAEGAGDLVIPDDVNAYDIEVVDTTAGSVDIWQFRRMGGAISLGAGYAVVHYEQTLHGPGGGSGGGADMGPFPGGKTGEEEGFAIGSVTLNRVAVISNWSGADGGGIYSAAPATINQAIVSGNISNANGGGIYNDAALTITDSLIGKVFDLDTAAAHPELTNPNVGENGGGLFDTGFHTTTILNSAINGNEAIGGGGIAARSLITVDITNSTVSDNIGTDVGGGITTNGTVILQNVTVANNDAATDAPGGGGGLNSFGSGTYILSNTLLTNNLVSGRLNPLSNCGCSGGSATCPEGRIVSQGHNLEDGDSCFLNQAGDINGTPTLVEPLADNGGLTETHRIPHTFVGDLVDSPAVDAGNNTVCPNNDQRGSIRPADGDGVGEVVCDIGAFELFPLSADLQIANMVAPNEVFKDENYTVIATIVNGSANPDTNVVLTTAALPAEVTFVSASYNTGAGEVDCGLPVLGVVTCSIGDLGGTSSASVTLTLSAALLGDPTITASVTSAGEPDASVEPNNTASVTTTVLGEADLALTATASATSVVVGNQVTVTFTVTNLGVDDATEVRLGGTIPPEATLISATQDNGTTCPQTGDNVLCQLGSLAVGGPEITVDMVLRADEAGRVADVSASVDAKQRDPDESNNTVTASVTITSAPVSTGGSSGGLCSYDPNGRFDPVLPLLVMLSLICLAWRRRVATQ